MIPMTRHNTNFALKQDSQLQEEQYQFLRDTVYDVARRELNARKLCAVSPQVYGLGVEEIAYDTLTDMGDGFVDYVFKSNPDSINLTRNYAQVPIWQKDFIIGRRELASSQRTGFPLKSTLASIAAKKVAEMEEEMIMMGNDYLGIDGLYDAAGNTYSTTQDPATYGDTLNAISGAIKLLRADKHYGPYNLVLHSDEFGDLEKSISTTGVAEMPVANALLAKKPHQLVAEQHIFMNDFLTAGTGLLLEVPKLENFKLERCTEIALETSDLHIKDGGGVYGRVFACNILVVEKTNSICTLTDLTD